MNALSLPATGHLDIGNCKIHFRVDGVENAPWVIFSNSLATNSSMWDAQVAQLENKFRVLRYDQRGHGCSTVPADPCTFDQLADDVIMLMNACDIAHASLVGVSMGAVTVLRVAANYPERVERVLACDGQWIAPSGASAAWEERLITASQAGMCAVLDSTLARWFPKPFIEENSIALQKIRQMVATTPAMGYVQCARALQSYDYRDAIKAIAVPCTLLVGEKDGNLPHVMLEMHNAIARSRYVQVPGSGHLPNIDNPDFFIAAMEKFLDDDSISGEST